MPNTSLPNKAHTACDDSGVSVEEAFVGKIPLWLQKSGICGTHSTCYCIYRLNLCELDTQQAKLQEERYGSFLIDTVWTYVGDIGVSYWTKVEARARIPGTYGGCGYLPVKLNCTARQDNMCLLSDIIWSTCGGSVTLLMKERMRRECHPLNEGANVVRAIFSPNKRTHVVGVQLSSNEGAHVVGVFITSQ